MKLLNVSGSNVWYAEMADHKDLAEALEEARQAWCEAHLASIAFSLDEMDEDFKLADRYRDAMADLHRKLVACHFQAQVIDLNALMDGVASPLMRQRVIVFGDFIRQVSPHLADGVPDFAEKEAEDAVFRPKGNLFTSETAVTNAMYLVGAIGSAAVVYGLWSWFSNV